VLLLAVAVTAISSGRMIERPYAHGDFGVYLHASRLMRSGENIYATPTHPVEQGGLFYIYPPLLAFLLIPLTYIPDNAAIILWTTLNVFLIAWAVPASFEIVSGLRFSKLSEKQRWLIGFFSLLLTARFILQHLDRGEANIVEMVLLLAGIKLVDSKVPQSFWGGTVIGLSIPIKLITAPFTLWYVLQKNVKALLGISFGTLAGIFAPALLLGWKANLSLLGYWFNNFVRDVGQRESKLRLGYNFSIRALLYRLFSPAVAFENAGHQYRITIVQLSPQAIYAIDWLLRLVIVAVVVCYWLRVRKAPNLISRGGTFALLFAAIPLLFPTAQKNYFVFLLPACIYLMYLWIGVQLGDAWFRGLIIASFVLGSMTTQGVVGEILSNILDALGCVLWATMLLMVAIFRAAAVMNRTARQSFVSER
jgi:hypothetical protein